MGGRRVGRGSAAVARGRPLRDAVLLFAALLCVSGIVYAPALAGPFVSDDHIYLPLNPWVQEIRLETVKKDLEEFLFTRLPKGDVVRQAV